MKTPPFRKNKKFGNVYLSEAEEALTAKDWQTALKTLEEGYNATEAEALVERGLNIKENVLALVTKQVMYYGDYYDTLSWDEYEYDASGNQTKHMICNTTDGSVYRWEEYEYDASGNQTKQILYYSDGSVENLTEYDASGNQTKYISYNFADGSVSVWQEYEYDASGNQTKLIGYYSDGTVKEWWEREYDSAGNLTKENYPLYEDSYVFEYEYDTLGNKIKEKKIFILDSGDYDVYSICENEYIYIYVENR